MLPPDPEIGLKRKFNFVSWKGTVSPPKLFCMVSMNFTILEIKVQLVGASATDLIGYIRTHLFR